MRKAYVAQMGNYTLTLGQRTLVVGIINVTPDSFSDGGVNFAADNAIEAALQMERNGADIVELGAESTRPGSERVSAEEELKRLEPVLTSISGSLKIPISVDTYKSEVAKAAIELGASLINDVSALRFDPELPGVIATSGAGLVLMHMRGEPSTMQRIAPSLDIFAEVTADLEKALSIASNAGIERDRLIIDPGIGFGKTLEQNLEIIDDLERLSDLDLPIMLGTSRKSFIGRITGRDAGERTFGTAASVALGITRGAHLVRVHDVAAMVEVARITDAIIGREAGLAITAS